MEKARALPKREVGKARQAPPLKGWEGPDPMQGGRKGTATIRPGRGKEGLAQKRQRGRPAPDPKERMQKSRPNQKIEKRRRPDPTSERKGQGQPKGKVRVRKERERKCQVQLYFWARLEPTRMRGKCHQMRTTSLRTREASVHKCNGDKSVHDLTLPLSLGLLCAQADSGMHRCLKVLVLLSPRCARH